MAVSFSASTTALATWGFSAGDIAVIAGAGRNVGTWVMAQVKDQNLLDFMKVDPDDLILRKGLIDPIELHKRWDVSLTLLQNGAKRTITNQGMPVVESMPKFSWFMMLVVSALDAALGLSDLRRMIPKFLTSLFAEHVDGLEYLLRELPQHLQGWLSAACVRNVISKARSEWNRLAKTNVREKGQIPSDDCLEVERLLIWLSGARGSYLDGKFETASSDVYALAMVLQFIGFDLIHVGNDENRGNESQLWVVYNPKVTVMGRPVKIHEGFQAKRFGMRVPLNFMEECVSIWPGSVEENNSRRGLFKEGMETAANIKCEISWNGTETSFNLEDATPTRIGRADPDLFGFLQELFPMLNSVMVQRMSLILKKHVQLGSEQRKARHLLAAIGEHPACLAEVQIFTMGYYYALLKYFLDASQLTDSEAYGSWQWNDLNLLYQIAKIINRDDSARDNTNKYYSMGRTVMLQLLAIFFAGADEDLVNGVNSAIIGVHGKLTIVAASLLGCADTAGAVARFYLLDSDPTSIPSNARGMVFGCESISGMQIRTASNQEVLRPLREANPDILDEDFSSNIEPDWDRDVQSCCLVYRFKGRVLRRFSPFQIEQAIAYLSKFRGKLRARNDGFPLDKSDGYRLFPSEHVYQETMDKFFERKLPVPPNSASLILLGVKGRPKARTCLQVIYIHQDFRSLSRVDAWPKLKWIDHNQGSMIFYDEKYVNSDQEEVVSGIVVP
ncbi:MAG: hypothetical protein M1820_003824 [Bogoriella megaspora]|nr:MAG: hypothetical protein M1820_003824 [Bogoriella megaspora]